MKALRRMPAVAASAVFAVAGAGFALATLIFARVLDETAFSHAVLMIALCNVAIAAAPAGVNGVALRHGLRAEPGLVRAGVACVVVAALLAAGVAGLLYGVDGPGLLVLVGAILAGGTALLTRSAFQRAMALQKMVVLYQLANISLLLAALLMLGGAGRMYWMPTLFAGVTWTVVGVVAWNWVARHQHAGATATRAHWRDGMHFGSLALAAEAMVQLERLLLPLVMGEHALVLYAVVAATALAPYRMLELGTTATLVARLRGAHPEDRLRILRRESSILLLLCVLGGAMLVMLVPWLSELAFGERSVELSLVIAVVLSGITRVCAAVAYSMATAFCAGAALRRVNASNWLAVLVGALLGTLMAGFGLHGLVYGVACGWLFKASMSAWIGIGQMRTAPPPASVPEAA